ncbi:hypothetical protein J2W37_002846 [Variovorax paradoxus]|uniref:hypothetical protein n=1 Tax=Variovorax paradoxus TaxID=34073 RepID=UPI0027843B1B|nr:hypothetical protein [Variovorax paradoxus]MDP9965126.1 hypothetical protein [Variovorax paradoxus]
MNFEAFFRRGAALLSLLFFTVAFAQSPDQIEPVEALPEHLIYLYTSGPASSPQGTRDQIFAGRRLWERNRILRVCFFGGNEVVTRLIREAASEWNNYSSVKFDFGPANTWYNCLSPNGGFFEIRIGFSARGYWSAVGSDSEARLDNYAPSMNFDGFNRLYSPERMAAVDVSAKANPYHIATVKHEFGHALGLLHELQNPALKCQDEIKWSGPGNVYEYFRGPPNNWSPEQVQRNLGFIGQTDPDYVKGEPNATSVMMYSLPAAIFAKGTSSPCFTPVNYQISAKDKEIVSKIYAPASASQLSAASDANLKAAVFKPIASVASPIEIADTKQRILADLESEDTYTRRNARARLADLVGKLPPTELTDLVKDASDKSYRFKLGVAEGIAKAPPGLRLHAETKSLLVDQARRAQDPTLKSATRAAAARN